MDEQSDYLRDFVGSTAVIPTHDFGNVLVESASFSPARDGDLVIHFGQPSHGSDRPLIRVHSECVFGEVLGSTLCDCAEQLRVALKRLSLAQHGILFYLRFDGRGAGLSAKVKATALEVEGVDTYESRVRVGVNPEGRDFQLIGRYLAERSITQVTLLTNNPLKRDGLAGQGIDVLTEPLIIQPTTDAMRSLYDTKRDRFGHVLP